MNNQPGKKNLRLICTLIICVLPVFASMVSPARAAEATGPLQLAGRWASGVTYTVAARDKFAFIGNGANLDIVNFSNSAFPKLENRIVLPSVVRDLALTEKFLYVADLKGGLRIIELADYASAKEIGFLTSASPAVDVAVRDSLAFLAEGAGGLRIVNVKNPANPVNVAVYPSSAARGVAVSGNYVYLADGGYGLKIINISDPANPRLTGQYTTVNDVRDVTVAENRAYLANGNSGLLILNVFNPANPVRLGSLDTDGFAEEVEISRNFALIADTNDGLRVVNVFNPTSPTLVKTIDKGGQTLDVGLAGDLLYLSTYYAGVYALNISNPANPTDAGYYQTADQSFAVAVEENLACIANNWQGLKILDIADPTAPIELGSFDTNSWTNDLLVKKNLVYLSDSRDGFKIVDISNPNQPEQIGHFPTSNAQGIAMNDTLALIADAERTGSIPGLWIVDIRDPKNPAKISFLEMYDPLDVAIQGNYAYVADGKRGLKVIDLTVPADPRDIAFYNTGNSASGVAVQQNYAFVTDLNSGLRVVDISDPNKPKGAGGFDQLKRAWDIAVSGKYAAVTDNELGLVLLDISTPTNPVLVENYPTGHQANNASFYNDFLYLTDWEAGVYIFKLEAGNLAPESPSLASPANNAFFSTSPTQLLWNVPADADNDLLHFTVELSSNPEFTAHLNGSPFRSRQNSANFSPTPPLRAGSGTAQFTLANKLNEGIYYWRVSAEDDELASAPASPFHFTVDTTPPFTSNHFPAKGAVDVATNTLIRVQIQDLLSGVNAASLILKINGVPVTPSLTGTPGNYTLSYQPATPFPNSSVVTVTLDASDQVGNLMTTDTFQFTIVTELNQPPAAPVLVTPVNNAYFPTTPTQLNWNIPADANNDLLHFIVELSSTSDFLAHLPGSPFRSRVNPANFSPVPPVTAGSGTAQLTLTENLNEGSYYWRVSAEDDESTSPPAAAFHFTIDTTPPFTANHFPAKDAIDVATTTQIRIQIQDLLSGVNATSLILKINGAPVTPSLTGAAGNYALSYQPATPFPNSSVVTVTLDASDQVGNRMSTDTLRFTVSADPNQAPEVPVLLTPGNNAYFQTTPSQLVWNIPADANNDLLHFTVELSSASDFSLQLTGSPFRSRENPANFSPTPPVTAGTGTAQLALTQELNEGIYYWRVSAEDNKSASAPASAFHFAIDTTPPFTSNHFPAQNTTDAATTTQIRIQIQDLLSGVNAASLNLKINGVPVTPVLTGSAENYSLTYQPATPFPNSSVVIVTLDASDQVGNLMATDTLQFTVETEPNQPPSAPVLLAPANRQFINTTQPEFSWQVPTDVNGDSLHFRLEISKNQTWEAPEFQIESRLNSAGFSPVTPQSPGIGEVSYLSQSEMTDGGWWWRVAAWDGQIYSAWSEARQLIVDVTPPVTSNHQPSKNTVGVDVATRISFYLQDGLSGIDSSRISLKINGAQVTPVLSGTSAQYVVSFTPETPFAFEQLVVVSISAADSAGNALATEEYSFITASAENTAPGTPLALHPAHRKFLNSAQPRFCWTVPPDLNGDSIHFKVEINNSASWTELFFSQDSRTQPAGFSPTLPVIAGADSVCYQVQPILAEGVWWWRVAAWDGIVFGSYSDEFQFTIDQTPPVAVNHNPSRGAEGVPIDAKISFHLTDLRSGVNPASIQLKINNSLVTPSLTGDSSNLLIAFTPTAMFDYEDTVRISIDAHDWVGNPMLTDSYYFITASEANTAPQAPEITAPAAGSFLRVQPVINWKSPADLNGDMLHFKVELDHDHDWTTDTRVFESAGSATGFTPKPPVIPGSGEMAFQIPEPLAEGEWWCRVAAWDGKVYSSFSGERYFLIDLTAPFLFSSTPAPDSTNVAINTNIEIILKDALSGIKHASIRLKINDTDVVPAITGNPNDYRLTFNPLADFGYEQRVTISIAAEDLAGNIMSPVAYSFTTAAAQNTLTATLVTPGMPEYHKPFTIQARLTSQRSNLTGVIYYRAGGSKNYFPILMSRQSGDLFSGTIPANEITERGLEFYLYAADNSGAVRTVPEVSPVSAPHRLRTYIETKAFPTTTPAQVYRLITVPIDLTDGQPDAVLTDDLQTYDRNKWRLFQRQQNAYQEFTFTDFLNFTPGRGFWLITREAQQLDAGPGYSVLTDTNFVIQLQSGWNLIGNPFSFPVSWDSVVQHGRTELPVAFGGNQNTAQGFRYQQTTLNAWEGYAVKNLESTPVSIEFKPIEAVQAFNKRAPGQMLQPGEWQLQLSVRCENAEDTDNFVGQFETAAADWDPHDFSEVPPIGEFVSLYFPHPDWQPHPGNYAADFRTPTANGDYWDFSVNTNLTQGEIRLETSMLQELPPQWQIYLIDKNANRQLELNSSDAYVFPAQNTDFRLIVGTAEVIENNLPEPTIPTAFSLFPNYPNPFNPGTQIRYALPVAARVELVIYNLMGQKIRTLVSAAQPAGQFEISWDGKNNRDEAVPSGIYWYRLRANAFTSTRKMVLTR